MTIQALEVGKTATVTLLVKTSEIKMTRANKPYLFVVFTDGRDDLQGQDWDYGSGTPPAPNSVLEVYGQVSEYMGKKQIKIVNFSPSDRPVTDFVPENGVDIKDMTDKVRQLIEGINQPNLQAIVREVFNDNMKDFKSLPAAKGMHHAYLSGLIEHTVSVALKAKAIAILTPNANLDLTVAGALLHDMGKLWTYKFNGAIIDMTDQGQLIEHLMLGAIKLEAYRTEDRSIEIDLLQHIISSHHGELQFGSPTTPRCIEAVIINAADNVDAKCQMINETYSKSASGQWTDKVWALSNRPMLSPEYIEEVLG